MAINRWIILTLYNKLNDNVDEYVKFPGTRGGQEGKNKWYGMQVLSLEAARSRRGSKDQRFLVSIGCHAKIEEHEDGRDITLPWQMADTVVDLFEKVDLEIVDMDDNDARLGCLNCHEATAEHIDPTNLVFGGEGDFAIDERLFHTVVVTFAAMLVQ